MTRTTAEQASYRFLDMMINAAKEAATFVLNESPANQIVAGWQPIETAPKDEYLLLWCGFYEIGWRASSNGTYKFWGWTTGMENGGFVEINPSHWHPLPAPLLEITRD